MNVIEEARKVFDSEIEALQKTRDALGGQFEDFVNTFMNCKGKIITSGLGKSAQIARKIAGTLSSLGTPSVFLSASDALHGDLGMVSPDDVILLVSYSGECAEIRAILPILKEIGATITGITGCAESTLAREADLVQVLPAFDEACHIGMAPTSSTTATLCYGDAIAVVISIARNFTKENFQHFHPFGSLGKK